MNRILALIFSVFLICSCNKIKKKTSDAINETTKQINNAGQTVGKSGAEFIDGISEGVNESLETKVNVSKELKDKGINVGKLYVDRNPSYNQSKNSLSVYLIFNKDFDSTITAQAFDRDNIEIGRTRIKVKANSGEAGYFDFIFQERTNIQEKSTIIIK